VLHPSFVQAELLKVKEVINRSDCSKMYLVQCAVNGKKTVPFWSFELHRRQLGDERWVVFSRNADPVTTLWFRRTHGASKPWAIEEFEAGTPGRALLDFRCK
jgi:hypothetical protein